jgi:hypothetical protein
MDHLQCKGFLVLKGYMQVSGVDFSNLYASVATDSAMNIVIFHHSCIVKEYWTWEVVKVGAAFSMLQLTLKHLLNSQRASYIQIFPPLGVLSNRGCSGTSVLSDC